MFDLRKNIIKTPASKEAYQPLAIRLAQLGGLFKNALDGGHGGSSFLAIIRALTRWSVPITNPAVVVAGLPPVDGQSAEQLIDRAGRKGLRIGGAYVSDRHANFVITDTGAMADDVRRLVKAASEKLHETHNVRLPLMIQFGVA